MAPTWLTTDLATRGGHVSAVTQREPKARHGRLEVRMLWALADPALNGYAGSAGAVGVPWPSLAQVCRVERRRIVLTAGGVIADESREVSYAITSRAAARADARLLARVLRGHWGIENKAHHVRDVTFGEDACQIRTGAAPQVRAACLNVVIALLRRAGAANLAAGLRTYAGRPASAVQLVHSAGRGLMK
jgi:predicted transposase YbfD/YdcC